MGDLTTFDYPGRKTTRGCQHMAVWLPLFSELCRLEGLVRSHLDVTQVAGDYEKSGGTHEEGTAADVAQYTERVSELAREAGAPASWPRGEAFGQPSMRYHSHLALDCSCPSGADYQITAVKAGYNGLGAGGRGGKDYIRRPSTWRNYTTGVAWMRARIAQLQQEEDDMPLTQSDVDAIASRVWSATFGSETAGQRLARAAAQTSDITRGGEQISLRQEVADAKTMLLAQAGELAGLRAALSTLAGPGLDLAAVEAAAKRGVEAGLAGASVVIDFPTA